MWQSVDPIFENYLDGKTGMGGIYNSLNLNTFAHTHLNPIKFIDPDGNAPDLTESRKRHEQAVNMQIKRLKAQGYTRFEKEVRIALDLGDGKTAIRIVDIAAMKPGETLAEASFHEVKTMEKKEGRSGPKTIAKKLAKLWDMIILADKIIRGASILNQLKKDIHLNEKGGTIQRTQEKIDSGTMNWNIYEYNDKGNMKRKGPAMPVVRGDKFAEDFKKQFID